MEKIMFPHIDSGMTKFLAAELKRDMEMMNRLWLIDARQNGFETVAEYRRHQRHWRSPWGRFKRLIGIKPEAREPLAPPIKWKRNAVRMPKFVPIKVDGDAS